MLNVQEVRFYVYANTEDEATRLSEALYAFVEDKRLNGIAVTANSLTEALNRFKGNSFVNGYLKNHGNRK